MIQKCETINEFIFTNAENYEKWEMVWYINKEFNISHKDAEKIYSTWRREYMNARVEIEDIEINVTRIALEDVIIKYAKINRIGITLTQLKSLIYYKKLGVKSMGIVSERTGMTKKNIHHFYTRLNQAGYKVHELAGFDFNKLSV